MNISVLCSNPEHPVNAYLRLWAEQQGGQHQIEIVQRRSELSGGDILFLVSCSEIVDAKYRSRYSHTLVLHASDLPRGRGWSPHVWEIVGGADSITLSLLEAEDKVDTGRIWLKRYIPIKKTDLWYEVNDKLFQAEVEIMSQAVDSIGEILPYSQSDAVEPVYYGRRTPKDSKLDIAKPIIEQFDLLRMCDPERYPAWFEYQGVKYKVRIEKTDNE